MVSRGQGAGEEWLTVMGMEFIGGNGNVLKLDSSAGFTALWIYENALVVWRMNCTLVKKKMNQDPFKNFFLNFILFLNFT